MYQETGQDDYFNRIKYLRAESIEIPMANLVQLPSRVQLFSTLWTTATPGLPVLHCLPEFKFTVQKVMTSFSHLEKLNEDQTDEAFPVPWTLPEKSKHFILIRILKVV